MPKDPIEFLKHIRNECNYLVSIMGEGVTQEVFLQDETLKRAVVRSLEIIGEATKIYLPIFESNMLQYNGEAW